MSLRLVREKVPDQKDRDPFSLIKLGWVSRGIAGLLIRFRNVCLVLALLAAPAAFYFGNQLDFNRSIESMFAEDDPVLGPYRRLKQRFGGNEIVLAVYEDPELLNPDGSGIRRLHRLANRIERLEGIKGILSLSEINNALSKWNAISELDPFALALDPGKLLNLFEPSPNTGELEKIPIVEPDDPFAREFLSLFEGYTHNAEGTTVSIACILVPKDETNVPRRDLIDQLRKIIGEYPNGKLTGEPVMVSDGFAYVGRDGRRLGLNSVVLLSLVIIACFRSIRWVLIPLAVMQLTLWMTRASLVLMGFQLSMVSSMLTAIVAVIAVATTMHVILRFREARNNGHTQIESMQSAIGLLFWPIVWSCLTDAAGFASLMIASVGPVQDFGFMMALASLLVMVCIFLLIAPLGLLGRMDSDPHRAWGESRMRRALRKTAQLTQRFPGRLAVFFGLSTLFLSLGNLFLKVETDFTRNFRADTPIAISYRYVEETMGGAGVIDVVLPAPARLDSDYFKKVLAFEDELRIIKFPTELNSDSQSDPSDQVLSKVISLADVDRVSTKVPGADRIPLSLRMAGVQSLMPNLFASLYTTEADAQGRHFYRVMLRTSQRHTSAQKQWLLATIQNRAEKHFSGKKWTSQPETTGFYVLLSRLVHSILRDQYWTFAAAILAISLVMLVAFRDLKLAMIALVPNLLPILVVMGSLGWLGIKINMGAAMIAAVSLGLSIDSSIHYLWSFQRWRVAGLSAAESILEAQLRVGRAVVFSTLALVLGFTSLCFSEFVPTIYFGALVGATMLGGLLGNLVVLPTILNLVYRSRKSV